MAGGLEVKAIVACMTLVVVASIFTWNGHGLIRLCGGVFLFFFVMAEVCFAFHLRRLNRDLHNQWVKIRSDFLRSCKPSTVTAQMVRTSEVVNSALHPNIFPFVEFKNFVETSSARLINNTLSPLLGFRELCHCKDDELEELMLSLITLNQGVDDASIAVCTYVRDVIAVIRKVIPMEMSQRSSKKGCSGYDFWEKMPMRWHFPWLALKCMELYENYLFYKAVYTNGLQVFGDKNFPVYVQGKIHEPPVIVFHGATCKFIAIHHNLMSNMPKNVTVVAPLFTPLWFYGNYSSDSHLVTVDEYFDQVHRFLQHQGIRTIRIAAWSLGCLLATGFLRRFGSHYDIREKVFIEPLGSLGSCCLTYACVCEPLRLVDKAFKERGGNSYQSLCFGFACFLKNDALSRCYWKLLPFRNVYWGHKSFRLPDSENTLLLLSSDDPLTYSDCNAGMFERAYFPRATILTRPGFHGTWTKSALLPSVLESWFSSRTLPAQIDHNQITNE